MYYILYKTINIITDDYYIGIHKTRDLNDGYMGSGSKICADIQKYKKNNFIRIILETFSNEQEMIDREIEIVTPDFLKNPKVLNIMPGGKFGSRERNGLSFKGRRHTEHTKNKLREAAKTYTHTDQTREKMSKNNWAKRDPVAQRLHVKNIMKNKEQKSDDHKRKISESMKATHRKRKLLGIKAKKINTGPKTKIKCPHCEKNIALHAAQKWHFDNCKENPNFTEKNIVTCPYCGKTGNKQGMLRWHFDKCKFKK